MTTQSWSRDLQAAAGSAEVKCRRGQLDGRARGGGACQKKTDMQCCNGAPPILLADHAVVHAELGTLGRAKAKRAGERLGGAIAGGRRACGARTAVPGWATGRRSSGGVFGVNDVRYRAARCLRSGLSGWLGLLRSRVICAMPRRRRGARRPEMSERAAHVTRTI